MTQTNNKGRTAGLSMEIDPYAQTFRDKYKWYFLLLVEIGQFCIMYSGGGITTLQRQFEEIMKLNELDYTYLIQSIDVPNLVLPVFVGVLIDHYGASAGFVSGITIASVGQFVMANAIQHLSFEFLILGLVINTAGGRIYYLAKNKMLRIWYGDHEMGKVTGISSIVTTLASVASNAAYPNIFQYTNSLSMPFYFAFISVCIASLASFLQTFMHCQLVKHMEIRTQKREPLSIKKLKTSIASFPSIFWVVCFVSSFLYIFDSGTRIYQSKFLETSFNFTSGDAGIILGVGLAITGCMSIVAGFFVDKFGKTPQFFLSGIMVIGAGIAGIAGNAFIPKCDKCYTPMLPLVPLSLGSGIEQVVVTTAKTRLLPEGEIGLAFAISLTINSLLWLIYSSVIGNIAEHTYNRDGYYYVYLSNLGVAFFTLVLAFWMLKVDNRHDKVLQRVEKTEERLLQSALELENPPESTAIAVTPRLKD